MGDRRFDVCQFAHAVRVAVEGEETPEREGALRHGEVEVLPRRVAVELDRNPQFRRGREHEIPVGGNARTHADLAAARMREHVNARGGDRGHEPHRLVLTGAQLRMRRGEHDVEGAELLGREIELAVGLDVGLDALEQPERFAVAAVDCVDLLVLFRQLGRRDATRDRQAVTVIRDCRKHVAARDTPVGHLGERGATIAPVGVHLKIAAIVLQRGPAQRRIAERLDDVGPAEHVVSQLTAAGDIRRIRAFGDGPFDAFRSAGGKRFENDLG